MAFALGLATTLALLGIAASFAGKAYGQVGQGLPLAASGLAVVMGLNLLEVIASYSWSMRKGVLNASFIKVSNLVFGIGRCFDVVLYALILI